MENEEYIKLIEKLDLLQSEIANSSYVTTDGFNNIRIKIDNEIAQIWEMVDNRISKIESSIFWIKITWYAFVGCIVYNMIFVKA